MSNVESWSIPTKWGPITEDHHLVFHPVPSYVSTKKTTGLTESFGFKLRKGGFSILFHLAKSRYFKVTFQLDNYNQLQYKVLRKDYQTEAVILEKGVLEHQFINTKQWYLLSLYFKIEEGEGTFYASIDGFTVISEVILGEVFEGGMSLEVEPNSNLRLDLEVDELDRYVKTSRPDFPNGSVLPQKNQIIFPLIGRYANSFSMYYNSLGRRIVLPYIMLPNMQVAVLPHLSFLHKDIQLPDMVISTSLLPEVFNKAPRIWRITPFELRSIPPSGHISTVYVTPSTTVFRIEGGRFAESGEVVDTANARVILLQQPIMGDDGWIREELFPIKMCEDPLDPLFPSLTNQYIEVDLKKFSDLPWGNAVEVYVQRLDNYKNMLSNPGRIFLRDHWEGVDHLVLYTYGFHVIDEEESLRGLPEQRWAIEGEATIIERDNGETTNKVVTQSIHVPHTPNIGQSVELGYTAWEEGATIRNTQVPVFSLPVDKLVKGDSARIKIGGWEDDDGDGMAVLSAVFSALAKPLQALAKSKLFSSPSAPVIAVASSAVEGMAAALKALAGMSDDDPYGVFAANLLLNENVLNANSGPFPEKELIREGGIPPVKCSLELKRVKAQKLENLKIQLKELIISGMPSSAPPLGSAPMISVRVAAGYDLMNQLNFGTTGTFDLEMSPYPDFRNPINIDKLVFEARNEDTCEVPFIYFSIVGFFPPGYDYIEQVGHLFFLGSPYFNPNEKDVKAKIPIQFNTRRGKKGTLTFQVTFERVAE